MLPNLLIIGAQKCGTTWLARMLGQHPDVFMAEEEIHFFDKAHNFARGTAWYESHFAAAAGQSAVGEKTPDYLWAEGRGAEGHLPQVHRNLHACLPHARLVVVLRDPVARAISAAKHLIQTGRVSPLVRIDDLLAGDLASIAERHGVFGQGNYHGLLSAYCDLFDRDQILVLILEEDLAPDPAVGLGRVCEFLGIDSGWTFEGMDERVNSFSSSRVQLVANYWLPFLSPVWNRLGRLLPVARYVPGAGTLEQLYARYAQENEGLSDLLERPLPNSWQGVP
ncbi:MAG: sulfotransferase [Candidatus Latescibacteria bacterium]|jgi:hypothetical protein|nr:sulfotransferase [Candidatus Latescibacterota bacterium]